MARIGLQCHRNVHIYIEISLHDNLCEFWFVAQREKTRIQFKEQLISNAS
jgi:hypothetical protein